MYFTMRLCASLVLTLLFVVGWAIILCFFNGLSSVKDMIAEHQQADELNNRTKAFQSRTAIRDRVTAAVLAEEMDLHEAAAAFRRSDMGLDWIQPMDKEESYRRVIVYVHSTIYSERKRNTQVTNRGGIVARLDREYTQLFGHPPVWLEGDPLVRSGKATG
jgi:hypothetical protein